MHLRVPRNPAGEFDALDQPSDRANDDEEIFAYEISGKQSWCHIRAAKNQGGTFAVAEFIFIAEQPSAEIMRDNAKWAEWATARGRAIMESKK